MTRGKVRSKEQSHGDLFSGGGLFLGAVNNYLFPVHSHGNQIMSLSVEVQLRGQREGAGIVHNVNTVTSSLHLGFCSRTFDSLGVDEVVHG